MRALGLMLLGACTGGTATPVDTDPPTVPTDPVVEPVLVGLVLYPGRPLVPVGGDATLRAQARWDDGSLTNVSSEVLWASSDPSVAPVDASGLITGAAPGDPVITGTFGGRTLSALAHVHPSSVTVDGLVVTPASTTLHVGGDLFFAAQATLSDGVIGDLGAECTWSSSDPAVASVGAAGAVLAASPGTATILAECPGGLSRSGQITVEPGDVALPAPDLFVADLQVSLVATDRFRVAATIGNRGGQAGPFVVAFTTNGASPATPSDATVSVGGVGPDGAALAVIDLQFSGPRPADLVTWVAIDPAGEVPDADPTDHEASFEHALPGDALADLQVTFEEAIVFGPTDAGIIISATNHGPEPITDLTLWFERDQPGATALTDLDTASAEASVLIPSLAVDETYTWLFDYNQIPYPDPWFSCGFARAEGVVDPDLGNNLDCIVFAEN